MCIILLSELQRVDLVLRVNIILLYVYINVLTRVMHCIKILLFNVILNVSSCRKKRGAFATFATFSRPIRFGPRMCTANYVRVRARSDPRIAAFDRWSAGTSLWARVDGDIYGFTLSTFG